MIQFLNVIIKGSRCKFTNLKFLISKKQLKLNLNNHTIVALIYHNTLETIRTHWLRCGIHTWYLLRHITSNVRLSH